MTKSPQELKDENEELRRTIERINNICFSHDLSLAQATEAKKLKLVRLALMDKEEWKNEWITETEHPLKFVCSECGRKVVRDAFTYYASIPAPDYSRQCPTCGHVPNGWFIYCSPECLAKAHPGHAFVRLREREKEIERIITTEGVDRETAKGIYWKRRGFAQVGVGMWKKPLEKSIFHKEFPKLAKKLGFRVYKQGWPDFLIEKNGKYVAVEVKERSGLAPRQQLMHEALKRAGLKVIVVTPDTDLNCAFEKA